MRTGTIRPSTKVNTPRVSRREPKQPLQRRWDRDSQVAKRHRQLKRVITTAHIVWDNPCVTISEVHRILCDEHDLPVCQRTTVRDLYALESLGIVEKRKIQGIAVYDFADDLQLWPFLPQQRG